MLSRVTWGMLVVVLASCGRCNFDALPAATSDASLDGARDASGDVGVDVAVDASDDGTGDPDFDALGCGPARCTIDGACHDDGATNPGALSEYCNPTLDPSDWSTATCTDGYLNGTEEFTDSGGECDIRVPSCTELSDPWTVALYDFDELPGTTVTDAAAANPISFGIGGRPAVLAEGSRTAGPPGCGAALLGDGQTWGDLPEAPEWRIAEGSVDLWVRIPVMAADDFVVVLGRDRSGNEDGHLSIAINDERRVILRLQSRTQEVNRCSEPLASGEWVHIGVNFGPPDAELWVQGEQTTYVGPKNASPAFSPSDCTDELLAVGLDATELPWTVAAGGWASLGNPNSEILAHLPGTGAIDELRISNARRNFALLP